MSTAKSTVKLFTPDTHEHHLHPQVKLADQVLPLEKKPKVLGVTIDTHLTFTQHCYNIAVNVQQHNNVLKSLAGSIWGCDRETLLTTYQAIGRSILCYCCAVWTPSPKDTDGQKVLRCEIPLAVLEWLMSPICIKRLGYYQFASITSRFPSISP